MRSVPDGYKGLASTLLLRLEVMAASGLGPDRHQKRGRHEMEHLIQNRGQSTPVRVPPDGESSLSQPNLLHHRP